MSDKQEYKTSFWVKYYGFAPIAMAIIYLISFILVAAIENFEALKFWQVWAALGTITVLFLVVYPVAKFFFGLLLLKIWLSLRKKR